MGGPGPDQQRVALIADAAELVEPAHVDQQAGVGEPEPQQRHQALPARDHLGVVAGIAEHVHGLVQGPRTQVVELRRDHAVPPFSWAVCIARQTRSGLHGIVMSRTPSGRSASMIAFTTAGVEAIVPASPTPLTPSRFPDGLSVRLVTYD